MRRLLAGAAAVAIALVTVPGLAQEKLSVWWVKGAHKTEDEALVAAIRKYEAKSGVKVDLSQFAAQDMIAKTAAALAAGTVPDVAYSDTYDSQVLGKWAIDGRLEDISDVIGPMKERFSPAAIESVRLYGGKAGKRAYYGFPLKQQTLHVLYWKDVLAAAGFKENDIPDTWKEYWSFWCDRVQAAHRASTNGRIYGVGAPMGAEAADSYLTFLSWADAYNVRLVDESGKLLVDDPKVRAGLVSALQAYTDFHVKGCTPPSSTTWPNSGNDTAFRNRTTALTFDYDFAIATQWLDDANNDNLTAEQRAAGRRAYDELMATSGLPRKPDGSPMTYRALVKAGVIFEDSRNKGRARELLKFLLEEENLRPYVEAGRGRWFPVTIEGQKSPFWQADKHRKTIHDQFASVTLPFDATRNYKFAALNEENVWAKAMSRVIDDKVPVEKAVDELIARIKEVVN